MKFYWTNKPFCRLLSRRTFHHLVNALHVFQPRLDRVELEFDICMRKRQYFASILT